MMKKEKKQKHLVKGSKDHWKHLLDRQRKSPLFEWSLWGTLDVIDAITKAGEAQRLAALSFSPSKTVKSNLESVATFDTFDTQLPNIIQRIYDILEGRACFEIMQLLVYEILCLLEQYIQYLGNGAVVWKCKWTSFSN